MGKRIFWFFLLSISVATAAVVVYVQSESFARILKEKIQANLSRNLGLDLNFDRMRIGVLPPSVSLVNVDLQVKEDNKLGLSKDTVFKAGSLGFSFRMIQAFSSGIAVNKVFLSDAEVQLEIPKRKKEGPAEKLSDLVHRPIQVDLGNQLSASIRQIELRNTKLNLSWREAGGNAHLRVANITYAALTPAKDGTNVVLNAEEIDIRAEKLNESAKVLKVNADLQRGLVFLSTLDLQRRKAALHASGKLVGSIDNIADARPDIDIILRGPISEFTDLEKALAGFDGEVLADAKLVGRLKDPAVQGKVEIRDFRHSLWELDKVELSASYGSGALIVDAFSLSQGEGRISLRNKLEIPLPFKPEPTAFQLRLENAKFEDFVGDLKKDVNNLRMRLDGVIQAKIDFLEQSGKVKLDSIALKPDARVTDLELNNQVYGKPRPYNRIFRIQPFQLTGNVLIKGGDVTVHSGMISLQSGHLDVSGTITKEKGFDLKGVSEKVNLGAEAGEISGIPIRGEGAFSVHVLGKSERVMIDFDLDQQNANFVNFDFGRLSGRVTYDDRDGQILIRNANGRQEGATYTVSGRVDISGKDEIDLAATFSESPPDDLFAIFAHQLRKITWIPRGMTGTLQGTAKVGGTFTDGLNTLEISSQVQGKNLSWKGEMIHELEAFAGLSKSVVYARDVRARKYETPVNGWINYDLRSDEMAYAIHADRGKLRSLDFLSLFGLPVDGLYSFRSEGKGKWETLVSRTSFDVSNAFVRTRPLPPINITYKTEPEASNFSVGIGPGASITGVLANDSRGTSSMNVDLNQAKFDFLLCIFSRRNCTDPSLALTSSGEARFTWKGRAWEQMGGSGNLRELQISKTGYNLRVNKPVPITAVNGMMESAQAALEGEDSRINFRLRGKVNGQSLDNSVRGSASLKLLEFITPLVEEARGRMRLDLALTGSLQDGFFRGSVNMEDGMVRVSGLDAPVDNLEATLRLNDSRVSIESFTGQLGGGTVQASGGVDVYLNRPPRFGIDLFLANNRLKFFPVTFAEVSDAKLSFTGDAPPYLFSGTARAKRVMMRNNFDLGKQKSLQNARYLPDKVAGVKAFYEIKIRGVADSGIFVENNLLNAEFRGEATLMNNFEFPQVVGRADLIRGRLLIRNNSFTLDHARIRLTNPDVFEPLFSIGGSTIVDNYRIGIFAAGSPDRPKITLSSNPSLPQEDIASLLAFGYRGEDTKKINPNDSSAITYSEVGSILLDQLQLSQNLQSKGLKVAVVPSVTESEASIIRPNSAVTASPKVYVQTQVMKNLEAAFGGTVGATQGQSLDARLEYRLSRKASVSAVYEQSSSVDATEASRSSYGADLKFRWGFR